MARESRNTPETGQDASTASDRPGIHPFRDRQRKAAIVFVHGFGTNSQKTWGEFLSIIADEPAVAEWDIYSLATPLAC